MIEEQALVTGEDREALYFRITAGGACDKCSIREACFRNNGSIRVARERLALFEAEPFASDRGAGTAGSEGGAATSSATAAIHPGAKVTLRVPQASVLGLTAVVYGVPLIAFLIGVVSGHVWLFSALAEGARAVASFGLGAGLLAAAGLVTIFTDRRLSRRLHYEVVHS